MDLICMIDARFLIRGAMALVGPWRHSDWFGLNQKWNGKALFSTDTIMEVIKRNGGSMHGCLSRAIH